MWAGRVPRRTGQADFRPGGDLLAWSDVDLRKMPVEAADLVSVVDLDGSAVSAAPPGVCDSPGSLDVHRGAGGSADIDALVEVPSPPRAARSESGIDWPAHRPPRAQAGECLGWEAMQTMRVHTRCRGTVAHSPRPSRRRVRQ